MAITGSGTSGDPYLLSTFSELEVIGSDGTYTLAKYYKLGDNIDASATSDPGYNSGAGWVPRGNSTTKFTGGFDGSVYTISGLFIDRSTTDYVGLFGFINTSNIKNVTLTTCDITGQDMVGGVVGGTVNANSLDNCSVSGEINGRSYVGGIIGYDNDGGTLHTFSNCDFSGTITSSVSYVGGIAGYSKLTNINGCTVDATINGVQHVGGIAGGWSWNNPTMQTCTVEGTINASGDYVGGFVGRILNRGIFSGLSVTNALTINSANSKRVGGIVGWVEEGASDTTITNCSVTTDIEGTDYVGGIGGFMRHVEVSGCSFDANVTGVNYVGGLFGTYGWNNPTLQTSTVQGSITATGNYVGGICGHIGHTATLTGLTIDSEDVTLTVSATANYVGGIVGYSDEGDSTSTITNCSVSMNITAQDEIGGIGGHLRKHNINGCTFVGEISGRNMVGGIAGTWGWNSPTIDANTTVDGTITATGNYIGGYVGNIGHAGNITGASTENITLVYSATANYVGGIAGGGNSGNSIFTSCEATLDISAQDYVGGITGGGSSTSTLTTCTGTANIAGRDRVGGLCGNLGISSGSSVTGIIVTGRNLVGGITGEGRAGANTTIDADVSGNDYVGLYAGYARDATIEYLTLSGSVTATGQLVGGVVGQLINGTVRYVDIDGEDVTITVSSTSDNVGGIVGHGDDYPYRQYIRFCNVTNFTLTGRDQVGGIAGNMARGELHSCTFSGTINGRSNLSLLLGKSGREGTVNLCSATGTINATGSNIGGAIGYVYYICTISNTTITNPVFNGSSTSDSIGGIGGFLDKWGAGVIQNVNTCTVTNASITGRDQIGGIVGGGCGLGIVGSSFSGTINGRSTMGLICGGQTDSGTINTTTISGTINATGNNIGGAVGRTNYGCTINGIIVDNIDINTSATSDSVGGVLGYADYYSRGTYTYIQNCTVTNTPITGRNNIGGLVGTANVLQTSNSSFTGTVTGAGGVGGLHGYQFEGSISNNTQFSGTINATGNNVGGAVGQLHNYGTLSGITIDDLDLNTSNTSDYVGGIIGQVTYYDLNSQSIITNCSVLGIDIHGRNYIGGLLGGGQKAYIRQSKFVGSVSAVGNDVGGAVGLSTGNAGEITETFSYGVVSSTGNNVGGLAGHIAGTKTIANNYSFATVTGVDKVGGLVGYDEGINLSKCYSKGLVTASTNGGGLVGAKTGTPTSEYCYWDTETSGYQTSVMGTGKTTTQMKTQSTYETYDFSTPIWRKDCLNQRYPYLQNIFPPGVCVYGFGFGNATADGLTPLFSLGGSVNPDIGNAIFDGFEVQIFAYQGIDDDLILVQMVPRKVQKSFVNNIDIQIRKANLAPFTIERAQAKMNNETIPITIKTNGNAINICELEVDTNHLPTGYKKLDIDIITLDNSNQFRRYIRVL